MVSECRNGRSGDGRLDGRWNLFLFLQSFFYAGLEVRCRA